MDNPLVFVGSDHAGFRLKTAVLKLLSARDYPAIDLGPFKLSKDDDYPRYCIAVGRAVAKREGSIGIVIGGSGIGEAIAANKVKGIRAAVVYDRFTAVKSREHNDANVISLRARGISEKKNLQLLSLWLKTNFSGNKRHKRRIGQMAAYESQTRRLR